MLLGAAGLGLALTAAPQRATPASRRRAAPAPAPHLTVQGTGQGSGTPDVLTAVFGFSTTASSSAAALTQNNAEVAQALQALTANGVATA